MCEQKAKDVMRPNLFTFATSELSQDAVLIWLASWAKPESYVFDPQLHEVGKYFIETLLNKSNCTLKHFDEVKIIPQFNKIDIFIELRVEDERIAIIIEDKVKSVEHSNQLERYFNKVLKLDYTQDRIIPIYLKTGFQHDLENVLKKGYKHYSIDDLLGVFNYGVKLGVGNEIFIDSYNHLKKLSISFNNDKLSFQKFSQKNIGEWNWWNWIGFFDKHSSTLDAKWGIVSNRREKLIAFWFGGVEKSVEHNDKVFVFHPYIDVRFSGYNYYSISYRLGLNGNPQSNKILRDLVIEEIVDGIVSNGFEVKIPRFRKAKETIELLKIENCDKKMDEIALLRFLQKMKDSISK